MPALLELNDVSKSFGVGGRELSAVRHVNVTVERGEIVGLVGESGSGKTTLARLVVLLSRPTSGSIIFDGIDLASVRRRDLRKLRPRLQMVFQNPRDALDPRIPIAASVAEPLEVIESDLEAAETRRRVEEAATLVALPHHLLDALPHQLSAGEQQRAALARSVITRPELLILDEPTSMLDASLRAGMVRTFLDLHAQLGTSMLLISHDIASVAAMSQRLAVMYLGEIVESGPTKEVLTNPLHPYTRALLSAVAIPSSQQPERAVRLSGEIPSPIDRPPGCPLVGRCPYAESRCSNHPPLAELVPDRRAACWVAADRLSAGTWPTIDTPGRWLAERVRRRDGEVTSKSTEPQGDSV